MFLFIACKVTSSDEPQIPMTDKNVPANDIALLKSVFGSFSEVDNPF